MLRQKQTVQLCYGNAPVLAALLGEDRRFLLSLGNFRPAAVLLGELLASETHPCYVARFLLLVPFHCLFAAHGHWFYYRFDLLLRGHSHLITSFPIKAVCQVFTNVPV